MAEKRTAFGRELEAALREVLAHQRGEITLPSRIVEPMPAERVKAIRKSVARSPREFAERFGVPEEIDTTPVLGHTPGAPSAPVWSLQDDIPDTTPVADGAAQGQSDKPVKKGWWQRAFSNDK